MGQKGEWQLVQRPVSKGLRAGLARQGRIGEGKKRRKAKKTAGKEQEGKALQGEGSAWIKVQTEQVWLLRTR